MEHLREVLNTTREAMDSTSGERPNVAAWRDCEDCGGSGFLHDGTDRPPTCTCDEGEYRSQSRIRQAHTFAELPAMYRESTFDNFELPPRNFAHHGSLDRAPFDHAGLRNRSFGLQIPAVVGTVRCRQNPSGGGGHQSPHE